MKINGTEITHTALQKLVEIHKKNIFAVKKKSAKFIKKFHLKNRD